MLNHNDDFVFQQDNATYHKSKHKMQFFRINKLKLYDWPAQSLYLNSIENILDL